MSTNRNFARIFTSDKYGQILVIATTDNEDSPALQVTVDTHPEWLNPTAVTISFNEGVCQFEKLSEIDQSQAEAIAEGIFKQAQEFTPED